MNKDIVLQELSNIEQWFTVDTLCTEDTSEEDKSTVLYILLYQFAAQELLWTMENGGEVYFIHPNNGIKLLREAQLEILLGKNTQDTSE